MSMGTTNWNSKFLPAKTLEVASKPPIIAARVPPQIAAETSCARRLPNSNNGSSPATVRILAALVAIKVW